MSSDADTTQPEAAKRRKSDSSDDEEERADDNKVYKAAMKLRGRQGTYTKNLVHDFKTHPQNTYVLRIAKGQHRHVFCDDCGMFLGGCTNIHRHWAECVPAPTKAELQEQCDKLSQETEEAKAELARMKRKKEQYKAAYKELEERVQELEEVVADKELKETPPSLGQHSMKEGEDDDRNVAPWARRHEELNALRVRGKHQVDELKRLVEQGVAGRIAEEKAALKGLRGRAHSVKKTTVDTNIMMWQALVQSCLDDNIPKSKEMLVWAVLKAEGYDAPPAPQH